MHKMTVYLSDELKRALAQTATSRGCSEAELIRETLRAVTARAAPPRPRLPLFKSRKPLLTERVDGTRAGFGKASRAYVPAGKVIGELRRRLARARARSR